MRYTTEYKPQLSRKCREFIFDKIDPTFSYVDNGTQMYSLDYVYEALTDVYTQEDKEKAGISIQDMSVLKSLIDEDVSYIEF